MDELSQELAKPLHFWRRRIFFYFLYTFSVLIIMFFTFIGSVYWGWWGELPSCDELRNIEHNESSILYSSDHVEMGKYYIENRTNVKFDNISVNALNALIATEDIRFYEHNGIDIISMLRVLVKTLIGGDKNSGGGSTISQQLAKNLFPREELSTDFMPAIKLREMFIASRLESIYNKDQILTLYLNTVSFGGDIYGIETAAQTYFSTDAIDLTIPQSATLIGMLKGPSLYNPQIHPERSLIRRNTVINQMVKYNFLTHQMGEDFKKKDLELHIHTVKNYDGSAPWLRDRIRREADNILKKYNDIHGTSYNLYTNGLQLVSTIDFGLQKYAEEAVKEYIIKLQQQYNHHLDGKEPWDKAPYLLQNEIYRSDIYKALKEENLSDSDIRNEMEKKKSMLIYDIQTGNECKVQYSSIDSIKYYMKILHAGLLAVEPGSGKIRAWVGGINFKYFQYDQVTAPRQVGSVFKPVVYDAAIHHGVRLDIWYPNEQKSYPEYENWTPRNSDGNYSGFYTLKGALSQSINTIAVDVLLQTGIDSTIKHAHHLGIQQELPATPSLALGVANIPLSDMIKPYMIFANGGTLNEPYYLESITAKDGTVIYQAQQSSQDIISPTEANIITDMLRAVVNEGTAMRLKTKYGITSEIAGKTGTTQNQVDGWFMGYTPSLVVGVRVGAMNMGVHFLSTRLGQGANTALPIYATFIKKCYNDKRFAHWAKQEFPVSITELAEEVNYKENISLIERIVTPIAKTPKPKDKEKKGFFKRIGNIFKDKE